MNIVNKNKLYKMIWKKYIKEKELVTSFYKKIYKKKINISSSYNDSKSLWKIIIKIKI